MVVGTDRTVLRDRIGHGFADPSLLAQALTHRSAGTPHNERLEFLGDGVVNLFEPADAIHSAARYLSANGWKAGLGVDARRKVIKSYNNSTRYANTILALAESVRTGELLTKAPTE